MSFKTKLIASFVALSVLAAVSMGLIETRLIQSYFLQSYVDQVRLTADQLVPYVANLNVAAEDNETCLEVAAMIYYNTGLRVLITGLDGSVVVDSSEDDSLVGKVIESQVLSPTSQNGEITSFDLPLAGKDDVAVSAPWQTGEEISGPLVLVGPLKNFARDGMTQLNPFILKAGLGALAVTVLAGLLFSMALSRTTPGQTAAPVAPAAEPDAEDAVCGDDMDSPEENESALEDTDIAFENDEVESDAGAADVLQESPEEQA